MGFMLFQPSSISSGSRLGMQLATMVTNEVVLMTVGKFVVLSIKFYEMDDLTNTDSS